MLLKLKLFLGKQSDNKNEQIKKDIIDSANIIEKYKNKNIKNYSSIVVDIKFLTAGVWPNS
jgi:hypothetical protein